MSFNLEQEVKDLRRQIAELKQGQAQRRLWSYPVIPPQFIIILGGQTMGTSNGVTYYGIEKFAGTLSSITTAAYNPGTCDPITGAETAGPTPAITAWPSGLGFGIGYIGGTYQRVMVVNDARGGGSNALVGGANDDTTYVPTVRQVTIIATRQLNVTLADTTSILAWSPDIG